MTKEELRRHIRGQKAIHAADLPAWSCALCQAVRLHPHWRSARTVLLYHALPDEPSLHALLAEGRRVLLPVVQGDDLVLRLYRGDEALQEGAFHIQEPVGEDFPLHRYAEVDLVLVPGMAFDAEGHRLGRGRGFYDRLLPRLAGAYKLGVCFPFQYVRAVPAEPHDVVMDEVLVVGGQ